MTGNGVDRVPIGRVGLLVVNFTHFIGLLPINDDAVAMGLLAVDELVWGRCWVMLDGETRMIFVLPI